MVNDPSQTSSSPKQLTTPEAPSGFLVRHNNEIVGIFGNEDEAADARNGYELENDIELGDTLDILKIV